MVCRIVALLMGFSIRGSHGMSKGSICSITPSSSEARRFRSETMKNLEDLRVLHGKTMGVFPGAPKRGPKGLSGPTGDSSLDIELE